MHKLFELEAITSSGDYKKLIDILQDALEVIAEPILAGGFAVSFYGFDRSTKDFDFMLLGQDIKTLTKEFTDRGYRAEYIKVSSILDLFLFTVGSVGDKGFDLLSIDHTEWLDHIKKRSRVGTLAGHSVRYVSPEDLILMKLLAFRSKDKIDLLELLFNLKLKIDQTYLLDMADRLGLLKRLELFIEKESNDAPN